MSTAKVVVDFHLDDAPVWKPAPTLIFLVKSAAFALTALSTRLLMNAALQFFARS